MQSAQQFAQKFEGVWPQNLNAVQGFLAVNTQWRTVMTPIGLRMMGLDYKACAIAWKRLKIKIKGVDFVRFQTLELEAINLVNGTGS